MKQRILLALLVIGLIGFVGVGVSNVVKNNQKVQLQDVQLQDRSTQIKQLQLKYNVLNKNLDNELQQKNVNDQKVKQLEQEKADLEKQTQDLQSQLQAKLNAKNTIASASTRIASAIVPSASASSGCGDNEFAAYIYQHESGCSTTALNSGGCFGIGQDCNNTVKTQCGASYDCQNAYFSRYAIARYGSWQGAYNFWVGHGWW